MMKRLIGLHINSPRNKDFSKLKMNCFAFFLGSPTQWFLKNWSESK